MIRKALGSIVIYGAVMYCIIVFGASIDFVPYTVYPAQAIQSVQIFFLVGLVFWLTYAVLRKVFKIISLPIGLLTFGVSNFLINIGVLYLLPLLLETVLPNFQVVVGSVIEIVFLSLLLAIIGIIAKYF